MEYGLLACSLIIFGMSDGMAPSDYKKHGTKWRGHEQIKELLMVA